MQSLFFTLLDSGLVLAGHGYDFRGSPADDSGGGDDGGGLSIVLIAVAALLVVGTVVVMWWLDRREREPDGGDAAPALRLKAVAPLALTVAVIAVPLVLWTASSGGDDEFDLKVERFTSVNTGEPELLVSLGDDDEFERTNAAGRKPAVRVTCVGRQGQPVLDETEKWPFVREPGYDYPHAHQAASEAQVQRADRCRVVGADLDLEAGVEGSLK